MMEAVGFELMHIEKTGANERTVPNGYHTQDIYQTRAPFTEQATKVEGFGG